MPKAEATFKEVSEAYSVLSDPEQRKEYDQIRAMGSGARFTAGDQPGGFEDVFSMFGQGRGARQQSPQDFDDIFSMFNQQQGGGFGSGRFGQSDRRVPRVRRAAARRRRHRAHDDRLHHRDQGRDDHAPGRGRQAVQGEDPRRASSDGQKIRLRGRGRPSPDGGETGDIVVQVTVRPHPVFTRDGLNLRVTVPVTFTEAALGATIEVPTLGGDPVKLRVAPGTPSGRVLRVKGRGVQTAKGTGDLLAEVQVAVPSHLDDAAREALERFHELEPKDNPRADLMCRRARGSRSDRVPADAPDRSVTRMRTRDEVRTDAGTRDR